MTESEIASENVEKQASSRSPWGSRIEQVMRRRGMSQAQLASRAGVDQSTLSGNILRTVPKADNLVRIAQALGVSAEWIMMGDSADPRTSIAAAGRQALAELGSGPAPATQQPSAYDRALDAIATAQARSGFVPPQGLRIALASILIHHHISLDELTLLFQALRQE